MGGLRDTRAAGNPYAEAWSTGEAHAFRDDSDRQRGLSVSALDRLVREAEATAEAHGRSEARQEGRQEFARVWEEGFEAAGEATRHQLWVNAARRTEMLDLLCGDLEDVVSGATYSVDRIAENILAARALIADIDKARNA